MTIRRRMTGVIAAALLFGATMLDTAPAGAADGWHEIVNRAYNQCIDAPNWLNAPLRLADCNGSNTQKWAFSATQSPNT